MRSAPRGRIALASAAIFLLSAGHAVLRADDHPRLLIAPDDVPRFRHACGVGEPADASRGWGKFGRFAADFQALRMHSLRRVPSAPLPGELLAAAFLHLVDPSGPGDAGGRELIDTALQSDETAATDTLELLLALDWCWLDLAPAARRGFVVRLREAALPLTPADSPLDPRHFRDRLAALALALAVDETDDPTPSWAATRSKVLEAGRKYFETTFPTFVNSRGLSPTGPAVAAREESDTVLAVELAGRLLGRDAWADYRPTVGRWLEHYVFATLEHPALAHNFIRDDGNRAPLTPAPAWRELLPLTAHLLAARTRDPAAALVAQHVEATLRDSSDPLALSWRWVPIVFDVADLPQCTPAQLPAARNLGGAVIFRSPAGLEATAVWIDAAQPFLRRRQHFAAGHFLVYRSGHLAVDAADDISFEAVASKGGLQRLGNKPQSFDFEQFCTATIAHNCLVCWEPSSAARWYGVPYVPVGGQRCIEETCSDFATPLAAQHRQTGRTLAYGQHDAAAYVALDLTPAYDARVVSTYTREFAFLLSRVLVVVDRVTLAHGMAVPTWVLNLPSRPEVDGAALPDGARVAGTTNEAGVWRCDAANWLHWTERDGGLWLTAAAPTPKRLRVVGGPAKALLIKDGPYAGRTYIGGEENGFERLVIPAEHRGALNAWYRLGAPGLLGPEFGQTPHWGRIEIEPAQGGNPAVFVTVLVTDRAAAGQPPRVDAEAREGAFVLTIQLGDERATLRLPGGTDRGGSAEVTGPSPLSWVFPTDVQPDASLK